MKIISVTVNQYITATDDCIIIIVESKNIIGCNTFAKFPRITFSVTVTFTHLLFNVA